MSCFCHLVIISSKYMLNNVGESMWPHVYIIFACLVVLSVGDLHKQITNRQEHQTRTSVNSA